MIDLISLWQNAKESDIVCSHNNITKRTVLQAITKGAEDSESVQKALGLSCDGSCAAHNASARPCHENIKALVEIYAPLFELMKHTHDKG